MSQKQYSKNVMDYLLHPIVVMMIMILLIITVIGCTVLFFSWRTDQESSRQVTPSPTSGLIDTYPTTPIPTLPVVRTVVPTPEVGVGGSQNQVFVQPFVQPTATPSQPAATNCVVDTNHRLACRPTAGVILYSVKVLGDGVERASQAGQWTEQGTLPGPDTNTDQLWHWTAPDPARTQCWYWDLDPPAVVTAFLIRSNLGQETLLSLQNGVTSNLPPIMACSFAPNGNTIIAFPGDSVSGYLMALGKPVDQTNLAPFWLWNSLAVDSLIFAGDTYIAPPEWGTRS